MKPSSTDPQRVALFVPTLDGGGAERVMVNLSKTFLEKGLFVDLIVTDTRGELLPQVDPDVNLINLHTSGVFGALPKLIRYLRQNRPFALLSTLNHANIVAIWAKQLSLTETRVVVRTPISLYDAAKLIRRRNDRFIPMLTRIFFRFSDGIIAVSSGVADDLARTYHIPRQRIKVIYNPIFLEQIQARAKESVEHGWFQQSDLPVTMGIGRLSPQKDFPTLLRAFARIRKVRPVRLVIFGEGAERPRLTALIDELGLAQDIDLPGFTQNPYAYMRCAAMVVLSSVFEGFPNVLVEALALGCQVISTDSPYGPAEILQGNRYGRLVPMQDDAALAEAMLDALDNPIDPALLQAYAKSFAADRIADQYLQVLRGES